MCMTNVKFCSFQYGRILDVELKIPPRPPCYCFVEVFFSLWFFLRCMWYDNEFNRLFLCNWQFENSRDAEDAIRGRDGYNFDGCRLRVIRLSNYFLVYFILFSFN